MSYGLWAMEAGRADLLQAENNRLREALRVVWQLGVAKEAVPIIKEALGEEND